MDEDLCYLPASEAIARFRAKKLSPVELLDANIARAEAVEPKINAFTYRYYDEARAAARASEARYATGKPAGSLDGLTVAIKDESYIKGQPTSNGSLMNDDTPAEFTSPGAARILEAGAVVHARTATPEFSCAGYTWSKRWGVTRNPWNLEMTPGGSSGGSGASLAAGTSALATGSDIGGSIRIPASCSGLVGYKPPYGRNPDDGPFNLDFYCHTGPMARTVSDAILLQNVMSGPHPNDIVSLRPKLTLPTEYPSLKGWRIALSPDLGFYSVDPDVARNTENAADVFRSLGATVDVVDIGWTVKALDAGMQYLEHLFGGYIADKIKGHEDVLTPYALAFAKKGAVSTSAAFIETLNVAHEMYQTLGPMLETYNVLICPTNALPAVPADFDQSVGTVKIVGREVNAMLGWVMTSPFNMLSRCPVISVPSGHAANGVPTGLQIVGRTYCDEDVFQAAMAFEKAVGGWYTGTDKRPSI